MLDCSRLVIALTVISWTSATAQNHTHGDAVGSLTPTSALVWTRASTLAFASVRYATNPALAGAVETPQVVAAAVSDFTAKVPVGGLAPDTKYWFTTRLRNVSFPSQWVLGPVGSFTTPPLPHVSVPVRFLATGDIRNHSEYGIFGHMAGHGADFFAHLGDMPYADGATTLAEYWAKHREVRNEPRLQALLRDVPLIGTWDDHEVGNDWDIDMPAVHVVNGTQAWKHWFPIPAGSAEIYRALRWGRALEYFVLDTRSHRGDNQAPDLPGKSLLGPAQLAWLKNALLGSTATFKVIGTSVPLRFGTTGPDHWSGYMRERQDLLAFIATNQIDNVVFLSADQHWAGSYQHREGVRDFQACPAAISTRTPQTTNDPQQRWVSEQRNYALITVDPAAAPATLAIEWFDANGGSLRREVVRAGRRARVAVTADLPEARFALEDGPFFAGGSGRRVDFPYLEPGDYTVRFEDVPDSDGRPADVDVTIPDDATVRVAGDYRDVASAGNDVLFSDGFEGPLAGYTTVDEGQISAPSAWFTDNGALVQNSNIYTSTAAVDFPGTMAVVGSPSWSDYTLRVRLKSIDNDSIGFVFRYRGSNDFYRFSTDAQRGFRRLVSRRGGAYRLLASDTAGYAPYRWYDFEVVVSGSRIVVRQDGVTVFDVRDADHPAGMVGLYSWGNMASLFDDLIVRRGDASAGAPRFADEFGDGVLTGWTVVDQVAGQSSAWREGGGTLNQTSNINDGNVGRMHVPKLGTLALGGPGVGDAAIDVAVRNTDNDAVGVVFRYVDAANYYRFSMDSERTYRRLAKVVGGTWTVLWQDLTQGYTVGEWYHLRVSSAGSRLRVWLDGVALASVTDSALSAGRAGLYCWGSDGVSFDDFRIDDLGADRAALASVSAGATTTMVCRAPESAGKSYQLVLSLARAPGIPLGLVFPGDPRVLELALDPLLEATLSASPSMFPGFTGRLDGGGRATAQILWPPVPGIRGGVVYAGGWVLDGLTMPELWPTVEVVIP